MKFEHKDAVSACYREVLERGEWNTTLVVQTELHLDPESKQHDSEKLHSLLEAVTAHIKDHPASIDRAEIEQVPEKSGKGGKFTSRPLNL